MININIIIIIIIIIIIKYYEELKTHPTCNKTKKG